MVSTECGRWRPLETEHDMSMPRHLQLCHLLTKIMIKLRNLTEQFILSFIFSIYPPPSEIGSKAQDVGALLRAAGHPADEEEGAPHLGAIYK